MLVLHKILIRAHHSFQKEKEANLGNIPREHMAKNKEVNLIRGSSGLESFKINERMTDKGQM